MDDGSEPDFLSCRSWGFGTSCGMWGVDCRPFESGWRAFRCPTRCTLDQGSSMAVFGSSPYRADSRICRAAAHAGVIGPNGGCAFYRFAGKHSSGLCVIYMYITYPNNSHAGAADAFYSSTANGVTTKEFLSWFPKTIEFKKGSSTYCSDLSWWILVVGFIAAAGFGLLPRAKPTVMFYLLVVWGFFYARLVGQPSSQNYSGIIITSYGEVMILLATCSLVYRTTASSTFHEWKSRTLKRRFVMWTLCYVVPFHVMINMNLIGYLPWLNIDLGGYEEVHANAGTYIVFTLVGIMAIVLAYQIFRSIYRGGKWKKYGAMYFAVVLAVLVSWSLFPSTKFHLHHTMFGAFILPLTAFPTVAAAFAQSIALGTFIQGYSRWGWHSYLDTILWWDPLESVEAYSLRLNRVEVYRGLDTSAVISNLKPSMTYFVGVAGVASWGTDGRSCALRLCIAQLHSSVVTYDAQARIYRVGHACFNRVQVVGVLVKRNDVQLKIDDGTGLLDARFAPNTCGSSLQELRLGALVECVGSIEEPWPPRLYKIGVIWHHYLPDDVADQRSRSSRSKSGVAEDAGSHSLVRNAIVCWLSQLWDLHIGGFWERFTNDYAVPHSSPPQLELLSFPPIDVSGEEQSAPQNSKQRSVSPQQHTNGYRQVIPSGIDGPALIEKPWGQRPTGALDVDAALPPGDYQFSLPERDQQLVEEGSKSLEIRLNDAPYSIIRVNDRITINGKTKTTVAAVRKYATLQSVLESENMNALFPQNPFVGPGGFNAAAAAERHYRRFFSAEEEEHYGLVVFQLAVSASKSQEDWSALILRQLEAKRDVGCSVADLRFAFPSLPMDQIMEILTNLQWDALVICANDKYRLV
ncbi:hypothetical protein P3T76_008623 [Phytophthora citrophthora]|uniref:LCCL domain-containing protein n=1 Tax=Phytophthora citrophthora TaxID=4793 RepID=A0AAD9GIM5_9STRA|nr:hypothetical protein P3T76_008623 [Phytophthora citrophthora]